MTHELTTKIYKKVKNSAKLRKQKLRHPYSQANMNKNIVTDIASFMKIFKCSLKVE
jgi:hypothetical protein